MSNCNVLQQYYASWSEGSNKLSRDLFADGFQFTGPMEQTNSVDEFIAMLGQFSGLVQNIEFEHKIESGDHAVATYSIKTSLPMAPLRCAEIFTFEQGKIKTIDFYFDPRELAPIMEQQKANVE